MPKHITFRHPSYIRFTTERDDQRRARFNEMELRAERRAVLEGKASFLQVQS